MGKDRNRGSRKLKKEKSLGTFSRRIGAALVGDEDPNSQYLDAQWLYSSSFYNTRQAVPDTFIPHDEEITAETIKQRVAAGNTAVIDIWGDSLAGWSAENTNNGADFDIVAFLEAEEQSKAVREAADEAFAKLIAKGVPEGEARARVEEAQAKEAQVRAAVQMDAHDKGASAPVDDGEAASLALAQRLAAMGGDQDAQAAVSAREDDLASLELARQLAQADREVARGSRPGGKKKRTKPKLDKNGKPIKPDPRKSKFLMGAPDPSVVDPSIIPPELFAEHLQAMEQLRAPPPKPRKVYKPYFIYAVSFIHVATLLFSIVINEGLAPWTENPWFGPSVETLVGMGAKYTPLIRQGHWWRFFTPMFLHVGIIHFAFNMSFQWPVARKLEAQFGWHRIGTIFILSGLGGNVLSSVFLPLQIQVGASGSLYGLLGVLLADLLQNWKNIIQPEKHLRSLLGTLIVSLALGLLPVVDNFAHSGGLITGILAGGVFLPTLTFGKWTKRAKYILIAVCAPLLLIFLGGGLIWFYSMDAESAGSDWCSFCTLINCIPIQPEWCDPPDPEDIEGGSGS